MKGKEVTKLLQKDYFRFFVYLLVIGVAVFAFRDQIFDATNEKDAENTADEPRQTTSDLGFRKRHISVAPSHEKIGYTSYNILLNENFDQLTLEIPDTHYLTEGNYTHVSKINFKDANGDVVFGRKFDPRSDDLVFGYDSEEVDHFNIFVRATDDPGAGNITDYLNENSSIQFGFTPEP